MTPFPLSLGVGRLGALAVTGFQADAGGCLVGGGTASADLGVRNAL